MKLIVNKVYCVSYALSLDSQFWPKSKMRSIPRALQLYRGLFLMFCFADAAGVRLLQSGVPGHLERQLFCLADFQYCRRFVGRRFWVPDAGPARTLSARWGPARAPRLPFGGAAVRGRCWAGWLTRPPGWITSVARAGRGARCGGRASW